jgi:molecular chaperone GrpE
MTDHPTNGDPRPRATKTRGQERVDAIKTPTRIELAERVEQLERELEEARGADEEHRNNWHRSAADFANYKRRTDEERAALSQFANALLIGKLLSVLDDFDRALESVPAEQAHDPWAEGVQLVERKLRNVLESEGVTPIEAVGQPFDPNLHEALVQQPDVDHPEGTVVAELGKGYRLHDRVLRPTKVAVSIIPPIT